MGRSETLDDARRGKITRADAAKLLGVSKTRVGQLIRKMEEKAAKKPAAPAAAAEPSFVVVNPPPADPRPAGSAPAATAAPPPGPVNLDDVLKPIGAGAPDAGAAPETVKVDAVQVDADGNKVDPDDAAAGRELLRWIRRGASELMAKWICKIPPDDPRLEKLKEENEFLRVALKRNSDKAAPLGWFTGGWLGLVIGFGVEYLRVVMTFPPKAGAAPPPKPTPPPSEPGASAPSVKTVQENRMNAEDGPRRLTTEEKIALMNQGK